MDILPDSRAQGGRGAIMTAHGFVVPIFCASCGVEGGHCPEENMTFLYWVCTPCFAKYGEVANTMAMPDEIFWEEVTQAQVEHHGHFLSADELVLELANPDSLMSTLVRSRAAMTPRAG